MHTISRRAALQSATALSILAGAGCGRNRRRPSSADDLASLDAVATAQAVKEGDVKAIEMIDAAIERAEAAEPSINAIVTAYFDTARERAKGAAQGPWFGVPTFIKDLDNVIGQRTGYGSRAFANYIANEQSPLIDSIFGAGLISLGKSATPEFGLTATTEPVSSGAARNPWNTDYSTGGSSGGAAALVAARVVPVAHASDGGGSIRIPASCCGVFGMKPSRDRMPRARPTQGLPIVLTEPCIHSRTVRDTAAFLAMMEVNGAGPAVGLVAGPEKTRKRVAYFTNSPTGVDVDPEVADATIAAAGKLDALGHTVEEISAPFDAGLLQDFMVFWGAGAAQAVANWEAAAGRKADYTLFEPWTFGLIDYYMARRDTLETIVGRLLSFEAVYRAIFSDIDLLVSPVLAAPPPKIGRLAPTNAFPLGLDRLTEYVCFTQYQNVSGAPAASLPLGVSGAGLPIGVQISAAPGNDRAVLEAAYELEESAPWIGRTPTDFA